MPSALFRAPWRPWPTCGTCGVKAALGLRRRGPRLPATSGPSLGPGAAAAALAANFWRRRRRSAAPLRSCATSAATSATSAVATDNGVIHKWPKKEIRGLVEELKSSEPILKKYLEYAGDPWTTDYAELRPLMEVHFDEISHGSVQELDSWRERGELTAVSYHIQQLKRGRFFALVACDVHECGFVAGAGLAAAREDAKQLAAQQALARLFFPSEPVEEIQRCADRVRHHEQHSGARIPAIQAAETLTALEGKLEEVHVSAFQPCGKAWQAAIACRCFEVQVVGPSADYDRDTAIALAGEIFMSRLRWYMRVPAGDPHEPDMWAQTWDQRRQSLGKPWSGKSSVLQHEVLRLPSLGGGRRQEEALRKLLPSEAAVKSWRRRLEDLQRDRCRRLDAAAKEKKSEAEVVPLHFAISEADPRRPQLRGALPIEQIRQSLGQVLESQQILVISGGTGSGKTTQLPQFLLDDWPASSPKHPRIVVTQPRRIAAISVAERVAWERRQHLGHQVGYAVHGNAVKPLESEGSIEFVTVGTLLRRAVGDMCLQQCDCVIVDEVHERDMLTDFLLILLREVLQVRPDLRLVLMSATLDVQAFTEYFDQCPVLEVQSESLYPVEEAYLEDQFFANFTFTQALLSLEEQARSAKAKEEGAWDGYDVGEMDKLLDVVDSALCAVVDELQDDSRSSRGSVLCFLPGWSEIRQLEERLQKGDKAKQIWTVPLHSTLPKERQQRVFQKPPKGKVKVILGTNIAESSVTIDDVEVVIDSGLHRELTYDPKRRMSSLDTVWISQSSAVQRRGRAGRVRAGRVLRLYSRDQLQAFPEQPSPEMQRCDLAQSCLQAVALGRDPRKFLADAIDAPSVNAVEMAMDQLAAIKAIRLDEDPEVCPVLLVVGEVLARLPLEPLLGRAAMLGCILEVPEAGAALLVAAGGRSPFVGSRGELVEAQKAFCSWSDPLAAAKAMAEWEALSAEATEEWAAARRLSASRLSGLVRDKAYLLRDLRRAGLLRGSEGAAAESAEVLETRGELEETLLEVEQDEDSSGDKAPTSDALLATMLCSAYPANIAKLDRRTPST
ncbi:unnamed protein product [Effrenium voratum]|nr:unnamed protein product [Effrenium voratum]